MGNGNVQSEFAKLFEKRGMQGYDKGPENDRKRKPTTEDTKPYEDEINLHGKTVQEALAALQDFISLSRRRGYKKILVICGKGLHSEGGIAKLRPAITQKLNAMQEDKHIRNYGIAETKDGGYGALYVYFN